MGIIYKHTNTLTGKSYIGLTIRGMHKRWLEHLLCADNNIHTHLKFIKALRKYGSEYWTHEVLCVADEALLPQLESKFIYLYDTFTNGYNSSPGGEAWGAFKRSEETKQKMRKPKSEAHRAKMVGRKHTEEAKSKMRISAKARPRMSEEVKERISAKLRGKKWSEEAKARHRLILNRPETKAKMSENNKWRNPNSKTRRAKK